MDVAYVGFDTIRGFRHLPGALECSPLDRRALLYVSRSKTLSDPPALASTGYYDLESLMNRTHPPRGCLCFRIGNGACTTARRRALAPASDSRCYSIALSESVTQGLCQSASGELVLHGLSEPVG